MKSIDSNASSLWRMESLGIPPSGTYPVFIAGLFTYCFILTCNITVLLAIGLDHHLHKPMYVLLFNLSVNDVLGATALFPQLISSILWQNRDISPAACLFQAILVHFYGSAAIIILSVMAYDRYVAICRPLLYHSVMTSSKLRTIIVAIWTTNTIVIGVLFLLLARFRFCRNFINDPCCSNPSLAKMICEDTSANNYYGLALTISFLVASTALVVFTYIHILITCLFNKQADTKSKAIRTCATHLVVFITYQINVCFFILSHRLDQVSPYLRRSAGVSILVFPPIMDPLVYGLNTKEIRNKVIYMFRKHCVSSQKMLRSGL
ncbi:olfactory receptor 52K2-like [Chanos chanos]|uniref:Olfactory receptor n=1 Tax=Chanos chanos TaxID=29144 RepID=A0A6J2WY86_CHACN|nr:olfactory receptor 52K2-like [Chanos chanos]